MVILLLGLLFLPAGLLKASEKGGKDQQSSQRVAHPHVSEWIAAAQQARQDNRPGDADSLLSLALHDAEMSYHAELLLEACNGCLEYASSAYLRSHGPDLVARAMESITAVDRDDLRWRTWMNLSSYYHDRYDFPKAREMGMNALLISESSEDQLWKAESMLAIGRALEGSNNKMEAFRNFQVALSIAKESGNGELLAKCYSALSRFYNLVRMYSKAVEYKLAEIEASRQVHPDDSAGHYRLYLDLEAISMNSRGDLNEKALLRIVQYADRHQETQLLNTALALFRSSMINEGRIGALYQFYLMDHPDYMGLLKEDDFLTYIRLKALFSEYRQEYDSADVYFAMAEQQIQERSNKILLSHFYLRYAEYLERTDRIGQALEKAHLALTSAFDASSLDYVLKANEQLQSLYTLQEDYKQALTYAGQVLEVGDSLRKIARSEDLLAIEISQAERIREMEEKRQAEELRRRNSIQYTGIVIAILTLFVILVMLGSFRVPRWMVQALGFFAFIFLFEFLILIADTEIHHLTHGEPWKILAIKIVLIAVLLPLHHWIEKSVVTYLLRRRLIDLKGISLKRMAVSIWGSVFRHEGH